MTTSHSQFHTALGAVIAFTILSGCSTQPPADVAQQMTRTQTSVAQAEQAGASQGALPELQQAKDKQADAQKAFDKRDFERALHLAQEAQLDAQYAATKSQSAQAQAAAAEVQQSNQTLKQEASRNATP